MKYIPYIIIAAAIFAADYYAFAGLNQPFVELHRREFMGNWFTGSVVDWVGISIFNLMLLAYCFLIATGKSTLSNPVGSNKWNYVFVALLIASVLVIYIG